MKWMFVPFLALLLSISPMLAQDQLQPLPELEVITAENVAAIRELAILKLDDAIWNFSFSPDNSQVGVGLDAGKSIILSIETMQEVAIFREDDNYWPIRVIAFSPNGKYLAIGSMSGWLRLRDINHGDMMALYDSIPDAPTDLKFSPNGNILAASFTDGIIRLFDTITSEQINQFKGEGCTVIAVDAISFNSTGDFLAAGGKDCVGASSIVGSQANDGAIWVWNVRTGDQLLYLHEPDDFGIRDVEFSPIGNMIISGSRTTQLWNIESPNGEPMLFGTSIGWVNSATFNHNGTIVATGASDKNIRIWNAESGEQLLKMEFNDSIQQVSFSPDSKLFAFISEHSSEIHLWGIPAE